MIVGIETKLSPKQNSISEKTSFKTSTLSDNKSNLNEFSYTVIKPIQKNTIIHDKQKKNPLTNKVKMNFLNPFLTLLMISPSRSTARKKNLNLLTKREAIFFTELMMWKAKPQD